MPDQKPQPESNRVPNERDPDYSALVPSSADPGGQAEPADATANAGIDTPDPSLADTSGTGTIVALGCIGATAFLIVIGLLYLVITQLVG